MAWGLDLEASLVLRDLRLSEKPKISENRRKIASTMLRERAARQKRDFFALGRHSAPILAATGRSGALPGAPWGVPGRPFGSSGPLLPLDSSKTSMHRLPGGVDRPFLALKNSVTQLRGPK